MDYIIMFYQYLMHAYRLQLLASCHSFSCFLRNTLKPISLKLFFNFWNVNIATFGLTETWNRDLVLGYGTTSSVSDRNVCSVLWHHWFCEWQKCVFCVMTPHILWATEICVQGYCATDSVSARNVTLIHHSTHVISYSNNLSLLHGLIFIFVFWMPTLLMLSLQYVTLVFMCQCLFLPLTHHICISACVPSVVYSFSGAPLS